MEYLRPIEAKPNPAIDKLIEDIKGIVAVLGKEDAAAIGQRGLTRGGSHA